MQKYKVNLDKVWNLPAGRGSLYNSNTGTYCAIGKILVGAGIDKNDLINWSSYLNYPLSKWIMNFNVSIGQNINDRYFKQGGHERAIRLLLEKGLEEGILELEDSDLELVRELKEKYSSINKEETYLKV